MRNIIDAIITLLERNDANLSDIRGGANRINEIGYALEEYVKNLFADSFNLPISEKLERWSETFSYIGNDSNPPDMMLKNGDAIEVKHIRQQSYINEPEHYGKVVLNSVFPKQKLHITDPMITKNCRESEIWTEKDILYVIGLSRLQKLRCLFMVYGQDYCASEKYYTDICEKIQSALKDIPNVTFPNTREFARIRKISPLQTTLVRICGIWQIDNPWKVFSYVYQRNLTADFNFMCIISNEKWLTLDNRENLVAIQSNYPHLKISDVRIKNPENPAQWHDAKLISYEI